MANIMTKRGNLDNIVTYEHICDTAADMQNIDPRTATLGSVCIVIKGENDSLEVYIADSNKEWNMLSTNSGGSGGESAGIGIHICGEGEYDEDGIPTILTPDENSVYFVPNNGSSNNIFDEWMYVDDSWEKIGGVDIRIPIPDWNVDTYGADGYINNKPSIKKGTATWSIAEGRDTVASSIAAHAEGSSSVASGTNSHAEGADTTASGASAHAEGIHTIAASSYQHVSGKYNIADSNNTYAEIIGNGDSSIRSNARTLDWSGNEWLSGNLILNETTLTENKLKDLLKLNISLVNETLTFSI